MSDITSHSQPNNSEKDLVDEAVADEEEAQNDVKTLGGWTEIRKRYVTNKRLYCTSKIINKFQATLGITHFPLPAEV